jgi:hypothetical protein
MSPQQPPRPPAPVPPTLGATTPTAPPPPGTTTTATTGATTTTPAPRKPPLPPIPPKTLDPEVATPAQEQAAQDAFAQAKQIYDQAMAAWKASPAAAALKKAAGGAQAASVTDPTSFLASATPIIILFNVLHVPDRETILVSLLQSMGMSDWRITQVALVDYLISPDGTQVIPLTSHQTTPLSASA